MWHFLKPAHWWYKLESRNTATFRQGFARHVQDGNHLGSRPVVCWLGSKFCARYHRESGRSSAVGRAARGHPPSSVLLLPGPIRPVTSPRPLAWLTCFSAPMAAWAEPSQGRSQGWAQVARSRLGSRCDPFRKRSPWRRLCVWGCQN